MNLNKHCRLQALTLDAGKDNVVTIFGFPNTEKSQAQILQEFGKCGDILKFQRDTQCNWMHIQYAVGSCTTNSAYAATAGMLRPAVPISWCHLVSKTQLL